MFYSLIAVHGGLIIDLFNLTSVSLPLGRSGTWRSYELQ